ncbi:hypothetical protein C5E45_33000 [Nocardia nova]|uniref:Uncharacterized protein n=1 Tax=Nocardia nova TaxID=37330 RepID=A0A2S6ACW3_9NOCA|nr:hypothetical protein [Nocardia nova]PPJ31911.1 hypothetical protein C5E45_33000 [Nocardia nova]
MSRRIPSDDEINSAAVELGLADVDGKCRPSARGRVAKSILLAEKEVADAEQAAADISGPVRLIGEWHRALAAEVGAAAADAITASLAPTLYKSAQQDRRPR